MSLISFIKDCDATTWLVKFSIIVFKSEKEFFNGICPDVIKNEKKQNGSTFIQVEAALGSVLLNMDSFFRERLNRGVVTICNVSAQDRYDFFLPIKKREDYEAILDKFKVDSSTIRLVNK